MSLPTSSAPGALTVQVPSAMLPVAATAAKPTTGPTVTAEPTAEPTATEPAAAEMTAT